MIKRLLILGGGSDIAAAFAAKLAGLGGAPLTHVVLAGRNGGSRDQAASTLSAAFPSLSIATADFDGADSASHEQTIESIDETNGPFDAVLVAFGQLGAPFTIDADPAEMAELANVNFGGAVSSCLAALNILRGEPNAHLIVFSSIAAVRPRIGNIVYGSAKSGLDAFARELAAPAKKVGVKVVVVRPGFVHSRMTEGLEAAPFATTPEEVAVDMIKGLNKGRSIIHSPAVLAPVGLVLKNLPAAIWRQLSKR
jgi:decaprenylphospho-beta-D-erythro-pentofuranosid-2-ulose 2-reductase